MSATISHVPLASTTAVLELFDNDTSHAWTGTPPAEINPGDWYWAKRNGPPRILKCKSVNREQGWVVPEPEAYWYNTNECFRLKEGVDLEKVALLAAEVETEFKAWSCKP